MKQRTEIGHNRTLSLAALVFLLAVQAVTAQPPSRDQAPGNAPRRQTKDAGGSPPYTPTSRYEVRKIEGWTVLIDKDITGCVSWAPDIYNLSKVKGNRILVTTQDANRLIADVWFARADFARDHGPILEGLARGIFDAMERLKEQPERKKVSELMAAGYNIPPADALSMLGDAHSTNWAENFQFFINENNPTN
ncbi:MAG TPA: hypothetical protein VKA15_08115, partial [Isosphaeraceae bacterium]|nr:hypothetical protein [Isosphaeraceae bacterium]